MIHRWLAAVLLVAAQMTGAAQALPGGTAEVRVAVVRTAKSHVKEALLFSGGSFSKGVDTNFSAFLVQHGDALLLFDSGLGSRIAQQYQADMPHWNRPFFRYDDPVDPVSEQIARAGLPPVRHIVLSHAHWDHASGLEDFPGAQVWLAQEELQVVEHPESGLGGAWPSQVASKPVSWKAVPFAAQSYEGFELSFDVFGDRSVVLVPLFGHTPGSIGMFVTVSSGKRYFFVGDVVWNAAALQQGRPKFWAARWLADRDVARTQATIDQIRAVMARDPALVVVPAHDGPVQDTLGYFPRWVK
jgi:glyoxylase-like metal-dependent hydrolase (beta-lactamase superfamily II)